MGWTDGCAESTRRAPPVLQCDPSTWRWRCREQVRSQPGRSLLLPLHLPLPFISATLPGRYCFVGGSFFFFFFFLTRAELTSLNPDNRCSVFLEQTEVLFRLRREGWGRERGREGGRQGRQEGRPWPGTTFPRILAPLVPSHHSRFSSRVPSPATVAQMSPLTSHPCTPLLVPLHFPRHA